MEEQMENIIWSHGEKYDKSMKKDKPLFDSNNEIIHNVALRGEYIIKKKERVNSEKLDEIMNRQMLSQTYQNPYLNKNFIDVLSDQDKFLIPQNSNLEGGETPPSPQQLPNNQ